jgi:hypothetical protein
MKNQLQSIQEAYIKMILEEDEPEKSIDKTDFIKAQQDDKSAKFLSAMLSSPDPAARTAAIRNPVATEYNISQALNSNDPGLKIAAIDHPNATLNHILNAMKDENPLVRNAAEIRHAEMIASHP